MEEIIELLKSDLARETIVSLWVHIVLLALSLFVGAKAIRPIKAILSFPFRMTKHGITKDLEARFANMMEHYSRILKSNSLLNRRLEQQQRDVAHLRDIISMVRTANSKAHQEPLVVDHSWTNGDAGGTFKVERQRSM